MQGTIERAAGAGERNVSLNTLLQNSLLRKQTEERELLAQVSKTNDPAKLFTLRAQAKIVRSRAANIEEIMARRYKQ